MVMSLATSDGGVRFMVDSIPIKLVWLAHGEGLPLPRQQTPGSAGLDLAAALAPDEAIEIAPGAVAMIPTGLTIAIPLGYEAQIRPRSGLAAKHGITVLNSPGTVDADYRGEVKVMLINHGPAPFAVRRGERIAQMVVAPVSQVVFEEVEALDETERGAGGHGSTGR
jgi:dUTP pyrophosphatase